MVSRFFVVCRWRNNKLAGGVPAGTTIARTTRTTGTRVIVTGPSALETLNIGFVSRRIEERT